MKCLYKDFNPLDFLEIAKKLLLIDDLDEKAKFRTSIGRAYYSAFLLTRTRLERNKGINFGKEKQHKEVRDSLKLIGMDYMADQLKTLFDYRTNADYYLAVSVNKSINDSLCNKCIIIAEQVIEEIEDI
ncbi:hypothetical protein LCGC14_0586900 [marine sediment metagenome]|uniref:HEPN domain-containing protein n=1 Tax=marine sediment metagenome TaxID=412755 RepID=A0A0F9UMY4_9ZZZZ